jgi:hypothetical protein
LRAAERPDPRRNLLAAAISLAVAFAFLPSPAEAIVAPYKSVTGSRIIKRQVNGKEVAFKFTLEARSYDSYDSIVMRVARKKAVTGTNRVFTETQEWSQLLETGSVQFIDGLRKVVVDTGTQLGTFGKVQVTFESNGPSVATCGDYRKRPGTFRKTDGGAFRFNSGNTAIGRITSVPGNALARSGQCHPPFSADCPTAAKWMNGFDSTLGVYYNFFAQRGEKMLLQQRRDLTPAMDFLAQVEGRLPDSAIQIADGLGTAGVTIPAGTPFVKGGLTLQAPGSEEHSSPYECEPGTNVYGVTRTGVPDGDIVAPMTGSPEVRFGSSTPDPHLSVTRQSTGPSEI